MLLTLSLTLLGKEPEKVAAVARAIRVD